MNAEKLSVDKILEMTMEDKKQMSDRINELKIIGKPNSVVYQFKVYQI